MIRSVLICLDAGATAKPQLAAGLNVARELATTAQALCIVNTPMLPAYPEPRVALDVYKQELELRRGDAQTLEGQFTDAARRLGVPMEWRCAEGGWLKIARAHGRTADLVVLAQDNPEEWVAAGETEELVLTLGRPALIIPYVGAGKVVGGKAVVAWDGSREAARAAHDALPMLAKASSVLVATAESADRASAERLVAELERHGARASFRTVEILGLDVGDFLLNVVADEKAELLVMGAYGHSRMRELVLGGATRTLFRHMTVATLMSH
jgi:nucleotide-binding universal stress UspA family protein